ncbi:hypothetical protein SynMEDNS5_01068 [Synechococcus sp. MEDNS5]|uniref:DUF2157 domain-containing protein n=1 Tax=Synechococcus sp. MEDNS5 TaxID=1442554 RepID=UPI0016473D86|nr:DUF2157 domain-containing protein [Synechococcus sp. MEDNS5]QNJ05797.1 hypothetical protein SynMEDNS5_01068 [Synechococcus sp. MEDNS5]|tara:strand:+ start:650 stop:1819 length:1170 start_codon:yes stop_codon:yes gene_type:complete
MDPSKSLSDQLRRWLQAELIDADMAEAIQRWEDSQLNQSKHSSVRHLTVPIRLTILLGSLLLAAGLLLFVSAHWDQMPPLWRVSLLLFIVIALHAGGAWFSERFQLMALGLHAVGTMAFGAGVFLCAQIFHLDVLWSFRWGLLLWSFGAAAGWMLLRQWPQLALLSLLLPGWISALIIVEVDRFSSSEADWAVVPIAAGALLTALTYFTAPDRTPLTPARSVLMWIGGLALVPAAVTWAVVATGMDLPALGQPLWLSLLVWVVTLGGPVILGWWLRPHRFWPLALAAIWMVLDLVIQVQGFSVLSFAWWGVGSVGLMLWGSTEARAERVNIGIVLLATTLIGFYFTEVIGRFDRSLSLLGLGMFFLVGGWGLNRLRQALLPNLPPNPPS